MRTLVVIPARTGSTRCPEKVLAPLAGRPLLQRIVERVLASRASFELVIATTRHPSDDRIAEIARRMGVRVYRGSDTDLLDRHYRAGLEARADVVVTIPASCPLIDPAAIDRVISSFLLIPGAFDYVSNLHPATWPAGNDVEIAPMSQLEVAWCDALLPWEREHPMLFLWDQPDRFRIGNVTWDRGLTYAQTHRFLVEHPDDLVLVRTIYDELWSSTRPVFSLDEVLDLLDRQPWLTRFNAHHIGTGWLADASSKLRTAGLPLELFGAVPNVASLTRFPVWAR